VVTVQTAVFWVVTPRSIVGGEVDASVWEVHAVSILSADHSDSEDGSSMILKTQVYSIYYRNMGASSISSTNHYIIRK
jgi:hypothetical protein